MQCSLAAGSHLLPSVGNRLAHLSYGKSSDKNAVISAVTLVSPVCQPKRQGASRASNSFLGLCK